MEKNRNKSDSSLKERQEVRNKPPRSLSWQLTLRLVLSIAVVSFLGLATIYYYSTWKAEAELDNLADEQLSFLAGSLGVPLWNFDQDSIAVIARTFAQNAVVASVRILDAKGKEVIALKRDTEGSGQVTKTENILHDGMPIGSVELTLTKSLHRKALNQLLLWSCLGIFCFLTVLIILTGLLIRNFLRRPLQSLSGIANSYASGEYDAAGGRMPYVEFQDFERVLVGMGVEINGQMIKISEAEKKYRTIFENALEGIFQTTEEGRFLSVNPAFARMLGYDSPEEMINTFSSDKDYYVDPGQREELFRRLRRDGFVGDFEAQFYRRDRSIIWGSLDVRGIQDAEGKLLKSEGFMRDITRRKKAEAEMGQLESQLRQAQKMEAIGTLSGGVAHEFNNMLGIILGNVELAMDDISGQNPAREFLGEIRKASLRGTEIVQQLLRFSRQRDKVLESLDLAPVIREALGFLRVSLPSAIEFEINIPEQCWPVVGDSTQIHQLMINLCTNSAHAMEGGGILNVTLENLETEKAEVFFDRELPPGRYVCLTIMDTGQGIDPSCLDRIFEPFFSTKDVDKGTGMGMAVVHGIIKGHNAGVRVISQPGMGTTVECCFPVSGLEPLLPLEEISSLEGGRENILCVDDEESIAQIMRTQLERLGYGVEIETGSIGGVGTCQKKSGPF